MTVTDVVPDRPSRTLTLAAQYPATADQVWLLWADPRQLERWWGPPTYPATVLEHELRPGGRVTYFMTGPDGERHHGWWSVVASDGPTALEFDDGFADADGKPAADMPVSHTRVTLDDAGDGTTRMQIVTTFASEEAMEQLIGMGMMDGLKAAVGQIDAMLAAPSVS